MRIMEVVPYDPEWPARAGAEIERLRAALGEAALEIEHTGSTSVPGLAAKPTLDFLIVVRSFDALDTRESALIALGYEPRGPAGIPGRRYYRIRQGEAHTHHIHCFEPHHPEIARNRAFRNALRADPDLARAYAELKQQLAVRCRTDPDGYTAGKTEFIMGVVARALGR